MTRESISLIVLAYDDAPSLPELVLNFDRALRLLASCYEIIVVDDGSTDGTAEVIEKIRRELPAVMSIRHELNEGVGAAFRDGVRASRYDVIGYTDGDGQYSAEDLEVIVKSLADADAVSGRRVRRADSVYRTLVSRCYNFLLREIYGLTLRDTNSGLKLYRRPFLEAALPLVSSGPFFDAEVMIKGLEKGFRIVEVPVQHFPRRYGRARGASISSIRRALSELSSDSMSGYVRRTWWARLIHRTVSVAASSSARSRWPRAATGSSTRVRRTDISR